MAEGNANRPAPETLTTEDVDRLSERFKPSWETEPQPAPRAEPARPALKQTMLGGTAPATPPAAAPAPPAPTPVVVVAAPLVAQPMATVTVGKTGIQVAKPVRHPTLVGIAPQAIRQVSGAPQAAPDDLDWELPAGDQPESSSDMAQTARIVRAPDPAPPVKAEASRIQAVQAEPPPAVMQAPAPTAPTVPARTDADDPLPVDVEELPPESKPSGIGQKYVPPDQNAPAIVLNEEVQRTEAQARAIMEAQHRARSAPTIAKMPAVRVPTQAPPADFVDEDTVSHRRKGGRAVWVVLSILTLGGGASLAIALLRKPEPPAAAVEAKVEKPVVAAEAAAPPPPVVTAEPSPAAPTVTVVPEPVESASTAAGTAKEPAKPVAAAPPVDAPKRTVTPAPRPTAKPKPAPTAKSGTGSTRPSKSSVIVRDNPF